MPARPHTPGGFLFGMMASARQSAPQHKLVLESGRRIGKFQMRQWFTIAHELGHHCLGHGSAERNTVFPSGAPCTAAQKETIQAKAKRAGLSASTYLLKLALGE